MSRRERRAAAKKDDVRLTTGGAATASNDFQSLHWRAVALQKIGRFEEALADNKRALALDPTSADTFNNIGNVLRSLAGKKRRLHGSTGAWGLSPTPPQPSPTRQSRLLNRSRAYLVGVLNWNLNGHRNSETGGSRARPASFETSKRDCFWSNRYRD
jgi:tetratricopeptide (TPR) repeat protein